MPPVHSPLNSPRKAVAVNDSATQLTLLCGLLREAGLEPVAFNNAETALAAMRSEVPPALIVTDLHMPGIDGWRFCRLLRSSEYAPFNHTPILVVSATYSGDEPTQITQELGANAFLPMPVDKKQFICQVQALLADAKTQPRLKVLVVEANPAAAFNLAQAFQVHGYLADAASTYQEGLSRIEQTLYDIAVLDNCLPDGSGDELLNAMQATSRDCVCIITTSDPQPELALTWMKMGAAAYLSKPYEPKYLIAQCERARRERALLRIPHLLDERTRQLQISEAALRESEEKYRLLLDEASDPIFSFNRDGQYRYVNQAFAKGIGKKPQDIIGKKIWDVFPQDEADRRYATIQWVFEHGETQTIEGRVPRSDGDGYYITTVKPVLDAQNRVSTVICTSKDITERRQAEISLKSAHEKLQALWSVSTLEQVDVKTIADHILATITRMTDSHYGFYGFVNDDETVVAIHSWSGEAMQDCSIVDKTANLVISEAGVWAEAVRRREAFILNDYAHHHPAKKGLPDGHVALHSLLVVPNFSHGKITSVAAVANRASPYTPEDIAQITSYLGSVHAIVDSKRAEEALRESEKRFRSIFENVPIGMFQSTPEGKLIYVNPAIASVLGYASPDELIQTVNQASIAEALYEDPERRPLLVQQVELAEGQWRMFENRYRCKDGRTIDAILSFGERVDPVTGQRFLYGFVQDITERKQAEQALRESEEKYRLIVENQHDLLVKTDAAGHYLYVNPAFCDMFEKSEVELLGSSYTPLVHPDDLPGVEKAVAGLFQPPFECTYEERAQTRHGWRWLSWVAKAILDEKGMVTALVGSGRDITERKQAEQKLAEQLEELRRWHNVTLGREERILELKREVNRLLAEAGKPPRYVSAE